MQNFNNWKLFKSDSPYRGALSEAILQLQESGEISRLKTKWWKEKRGGGACAGVSRGLDLSHNEENLRS